MASGSTLLDRPLTQPAILQPTDLLSRNTASQCFWLRVSLAIVYIWFGALKPLGLSPASQLVTLTVPWLSPEFFVPFLGYWEVAIGLGFLFRPTVRIALALMALQMLGTLMPLVFLPEICYVRFPFVLTLEGQYIIKNVVLIAAAMAVASNLQRKCGQ